jgi:hypothetical protein
MTHESIPSKSETTLKAFGIGDQVSVTRTDGTVEGDWKIADIQYTEGSAEIAYFVVRKPADGGGYLEKKVTTEQLQAWNNSHDNTRPYGGAELLRDSLNSSLGMMASKLDSGRPSEEFDPEEANLRRSIADAIEEKRRAQQIGDGEASMYWGQIAGQYTLELNEYRAKK